MSCNCGAAGGSAPVVGFVLAERGKPLIGLEKRLSCAARVAGVVLQFSVRKDYEMPGSSVADTPAVLHDGHFAFRGLSNTEEMEAWLKTL